MRVVERTETTLGGFFVDPPHLAGAAPDGGRLWTLVGIENYLATGRHGIGTPEESLPFPAMRRLQVKSPQIRKSLPPELGAKPGSWYLEAIVDRRRKRISPSPVALDPGGDLQDWQDLPWVKRQGGQPVRVTTDPTSSGTVLLDTLENRVREWVSLPVASPITEIVVDPAFVQVVGRASGVIDADLDGGPGVTRTVFDEGERLSGIQALARRMGPRPFSRLTGTPHGVAQRAAAGDQISDRNVEKILRALQIDPARRVCDLESCKVVISRPNSLYCSEAHRRHAHRARKQVAKSAVDPFGSLPTCPGCGAVLLGAAAKRGTCLSCMEEVA